MKPFHMKLYRPLLFLGLLALLAPIGKALAVDAIHSPQNGATLGTTQTFNWFPIGTSASYNCLYIGSQGTGTGNIFSGCTTAKSLTLSALPNNGGRVWVRLWSYINGTWLYRDYQYTAAGSDYSHSNWPVELSGYSFFNSGTTLHLTWALPSPSGIVSQYYVYVGTSQGSANLGAQWRSGDKTEAAIHGLPPSGTLWVRFWSYHATKGWGYQDGLVRF